MIAPTEREKKLLEYILTMFKMLSLYAITFDAVYKNQRWLFDRETEMDARSSEDEIMKYLNDEFGLHLKEYHPEPGIKVENEEPNVI